MSSIIKWIRELEQEDFVHFLLRVHLFFMRIDNQVKKSHDKLVESLQSPDKLIEGQRLQAGICDADKTTASNGAGANINWDWREFPKPLPLTGYYTCFSNCWMIYSVVRTLFRDQLVELVDTTLGEFIHLKGNCLLLGRTILHPAFGETSSIIFPLFHLIWRSNIVLSNRYFMLTMINYLLHSNADTERFLGLLEDESRVEYSSFEQPVAGKRSKNVYKNKFIVEPAGNEHATGSHSAEMQELVGSLNEQLVRHAMCYQVYHETRLYYRLRPNRTREARSLLSGQVIKSFIVVTVILGLLVVTVGIYATLVIFSDRFYLDTYLGCCQQLDDLVASEQLPFYSITLGAHHVVSILIDGIENAVIWLDCAQAMLYGWLFCYLFNYDLLLYWSGLHAKLESLLERVRRKNSFRLDVLQNQLAISSSDELSNESDVRDYLIRTRPKPSGDVNKQTSCLSTMWDTLNQFDSRLEIEIHEVLFEMFDFFEEVGRVDLLVSDVLSVSIFVWLTCCAMIGYNSVAIERSLPLVIKMMLITGFTVVATATHFLVALRRRCLLTYRTLCSLMAHNRSNEKRHFVKLMDFFIQINRTTYTLVHQYPYEPTTFINIIGYSASCFLIATTLFGDKQSGTKENTRRLPVAEAHNSFERILELLGIYY